MLIEKIRSDGIPSGRSLNSSFSLSRRKIVDNVGEHTIDQKIIKKNSARMCVQLPYADDAPQSRDPSYNAVTGRSFHFPSSPFVEFSSDNAARTNAAVKFFAPCLARARLLLPRNNEFPSAYGSSHAPLSG